MNREQVRDLTANPVSTDFVVSFLSSQGVDTVKASPYGEYIRASAKVAVWERLFATTFYTFKHVDNSVSPVFRATEYSLPLILVDHVFAVFNTVHLPNLMAPKGKPMVRLAYATCRRNNYYLYYVRLRQQLRPLALSLLRC